MFIDSFESAEAAGEAMHDAMIEAVPSRNDGRYGRHRHVLREQQERIRKQLWKFWVWLYRFNKNAQTNDYVYRKRMKKKETGNLLALPFR